MRGFPPSLRPNSGASLELPLICAHLRTANLHTIFCAFLICAHSHLRTCSSNLRLCTWRWFQKMFDLASHGWGIAFSNDYEVSWLDMHKRKLMGNMIKWLNFINVYMRGGSAPAYKQAVHCPASTIVFRKFLRKFSKFSWENTKNALF